jgi:hypothetical protein
LLQQVKIKLAAHNAFLITNSGFTEEARAAAANERIALHVVQPVFNPRRLPATDRDQIQRQLQGIAGANPELPLYVHQVIHKGLDQGSTEQVAAADAGGRYQDPALARGAGSWPPAPSVIVNARAVGPPTPAARLQASAVKPGRP